MKRLAKHFITHILPATALAATCLAAPAVLAASNSKKPVSYGTSDAARTFIERQMDIWGKVVKDNNIKAD